MADVPPDDDNNSLFCEPTSSQSQIYDPRQEIHRLGVKQEELVEKLYNDLSSKDEAIKQLQTKADDLERICDAITEKDLNNKELQKELDTARKAVEEKDLNNKELQKELDIARKAVEENDKNIKALQFDKAKLDVALRKAVASDGQKDSSITELKQENMRLVERIKNGDAKFGELQHKYERVVKDNQWLDESMEATLIENNRKERVIKGFQARQHDANRNFPAQRHHESDRNIGDYVPGQYLAALREAERRMSPKTVEREPVQRSQQVSSFEPPRRPASMHPDRQPPIGLPARPPVTDRSVQREETSSNRLPATPKQEDDKVKRESTTPDDAERRRNGSLTTYDAKRDPRARALKPVDGTTTPKQPADDPDDDPAFMVSARKRRAEVYEQLKANKEKKVRFT